MFKNFLLPNKLYDVLKWIVLIALPACSVLYNVLATIWNWGLKEEISMTLSAVCVFIGSLIGISTMNYNELKNLK